jgi:hypothetical protein
MPSKLRFNVIHTPCNNLIIQYLIQQIAQSIINNDLTFMLLLYVSTSTKLSSWRHIQSSFYAFVYTFMMMALWRSKHVGGTQVTMIIYY